MEAFYKALHEELTKQLKRENKVQNYREELEKERLKNLLNVLNALISIYSFLDDVKEEAADARQEQDIESDKEVARLRKELLGKDEEIEQLLSLNP